jgi:uncharacterized protein (DUF2141 family)
MFRCPEYRHSGITKGVITMRLFVAAFLCSILFPGIAMAGDLSLSIDGVKDNTGFVIGALYTDKATFMDQTKAYQLFKVNAAPGQVKYVVRGLPAGRYAISVCHDANNNGEMDKNFIGAPLEGFGFSNDPEVTTGPPEFEQAVFTYNGQSQAMSIKMTYLNF